MKKTECTACHAKILFATAERNSGLCEPCANHQSRLKACADSGCLDNGSHSIALERTLKFGLLYSCAKCNQQWVEHEFLREIVPIESDKKSIFDAWAQKPLTLSQEQLTILKKIGAVEHNKMRRYFEIPCGVVTRTGERYDRAVLCFQSFPPIGWQSERYYNGISLCDEIAEVYPSDYTLPYDVRLETQQNSTGCAPSDFKSTIVSDRKGTAYALEGWIHFFEHHNVLGKDISLVNTNKIKEPLDIPRHHVKYWFSKRSQLHFFVADYSSELAEYFFSNETGQPPKTLPNNVYLFNEAIIERNPNALPPLINNLVASRDIISEENVSLDLLKDLYTSAFMDAYVDEDGDLRIEEQGQGCYLSLPSSKYWIELFCLFEAKDEVPWESRIAFTNQFVNAYHFARAYVTDDGDIRFEAYIPIQGGVTRKAIYLATKYFLTIFADGIDLDEDEILK